MRLILVVVVVFAAGLSLLPAAPASASGAYPGYYEFYPSSSGYIEDGWYARAADLDHNGRDELITGWSDYGTNGSYIQIRTFGGAIWELSQRTILQLASTIGYNPGRVAVADLDHDGDLDLIVPLADSLYLVPTITAASFGPPSRLYIPGLSGVAAADFDHDGIVDLAVSLYSPSRVQILRGTGPFSFEGIGEYPTHGSPDNVDVADFNGDGIPDVLVGADTASTVLVGDGTGGFSATEIPLKYAASAGDLNGDGFDDVISTSASCLSAGDGSFQPPVAFPALIAVVTTDLDEDGRPDLVGIKLVSPGTLMSVQHGLGDGTFGQAALYPYCRGGTQTFVAGDFDGDGHHDVAQPSRHGTDGVMFGLGNGLFQGPRVVPSGMAGGSLKAGEFGSHTGKDLLIVRSVANSMGIMHRTGLAQWSLPDTVALPGIPGAGGPEVADLNADGRDDVVLAYDNLAVVSYWLTDATGHLGPRVDLPEPDAVYNKTIEIAVGDVDGDGDADILYQPEGIPLGWYRGAGDGTFTYNGTLPYFAALGNLEIRDLNGDGLPDLAMMNGNYGIRVVLASAPGVFGPYTDLAAPFPYFAQHFVVGRLDGDATLDLALSQGALNTGPTWLFHGNGNGTFAAPVGLPREAGFGWDAYTRDLDGDGRDEIIGGPGYMSLNPDGTFAGAVNFGVPGWSVALDADDNGSLDLVMASPELSLKVLLSKAGTQVLGVTPPRTGPSSIVLTALRNPSRGEIVVRLSSSRAGPASLELFDLQGRRLGASTANTTPAMPRTVTLRHAGALPPGVYLVVARQADRVASTRVTVLR
jgi:hypothetical protein